MIDLNETHKWFAEIYAPESEEKRFSAEISYSPIKGLSVDFFFSGARDVKDTNILFGVSSEGKLFTLIGDFKFSNSGYFFNQSHTTKRGVVFATFLIWGAHVKGDQKFNSIYFSFENLKNFFYLNGFEDAIPNSRDPILQVECSNTKVTAFNAGSFQFVGNGIENIIHIFDEVENTRLRDVLRNHLIKFPGAAAHLRTGIKTRFGVECDEPESLSFLYDKANLIVDLFSLFFYMPVKLNEVSVCLETESNGPAVYEICTGYTVNQSTFEFGSREINHRQAPINNHKIDLGVTIPKWFDITDQFRSLVASVQGEILSRNEHTAHGEFVLFATQIESISYDLGGKKQFSKYSTAISKFGSLQLIEHLKRICGTSSILDVAKNIKYLRDEIAHVGRPKKYLEIHNLTSVIDISHLMQLVVIGFLFSRLGISTPVISQYQDYHLPKR